MALSVPFTHSLIHSPPTYKFGISIRGEHHCSSLGGRLFEFP